jgi:methylmalonyl-CoA/ethylmalonyl-CoA epimerase
MIKGSRFHHIGYAVKDIIETAENYISMGWVLSEVYVDVIQNSQIAFLKKEGFPLIELVAAVDDKSPVVNTLKKSGVSPYHVCYEVDDIDIAIKELNEMSFFTLFDPVPAIAFENRLICYLYSVSVGLIELVSAK